jgi:hypothetical protein
VTTQSLQALPLATQVSQSTCSTPMLIPSEADPLISPFRRALTLSWCRNRRGRSTRMDITTRCFDRTAGELLRTPRPSCFHA